MATIDIGKIKPVFKGAYDGSTAYVLDDIVYYLGSSYVAKTSTTGNLPTDATKWNVLASGSGGIWDSTLSLGSAGQAVKVNSAGNALEFGSAGGLVSTSFHQNTTSHTITSNSPVEVNGSSFTVSMTAGEKIHLFPLVRGYQNTNDKVDYIAMFVTESGGSELNILSTATGSGGMGLTDGSNAYGRYWNTGAEDHGWSFSQFHTWTAQTTGTHTFKMKMWNNASADLRTQGTITWYMITKV